MFVPLFLQAATGATPTEAGLLLVPAMLGITVSTTLSGRSIARTGRYKRFPVAGLALMTAALVLLAALAGDPSRLATGVGLVALRPRLRDGHPGADRRRSRTASSGASSGSPPRRPGSSARSAAPSAPRCSALCSRRRAGIGAPGQGARSARGEVIDGVQSVFLVAAPIAALALLVVLLLQEVPLSSDAAPAASGERARTVPTPKGALAQEAR